MESNSTPTISKIFHPALAIASRIKTCFFCTEIRAGKAFKSRPMNVKEVDQEGNIYFLSDRFSRKNAELNQDPMVQLMFVDLTKPEYLSLSGKARMFYDKQKIKELWDQEMNDWIPGAESNPRISIIQVRPLSGQYWDQPNQTMRSFTLHKTSESIFSTMSNLRSI
jgi:general stress protein 26